MSIRAQAPMRLRTFSVLSKTWPGAHTANLARKSSQSVLRSGNSSLRLKSRAKAPTKVLSTDHSSQRMLAIISSVMGGLASAGLASAGFGPGGLGFLPGLPLRRLGLGGLGLGRRDLGRFRLGGLRVLRRQRQADGQQHGEAQGYVAQRAHLHLVGHGFASQGYGAEDAALTRALPASTTRRPRSRWPAPGPPTATRCAAGAGPIPSGTASSRRWWRRCR